MGATQRTLMGFLGGLTLGVLTFLKAGFYLTADSTDTDRLIGYIAVAAYIFLGAVASGIFSDLERPVEKQRIQAFVTGLIAPSLLFTIVSRPPSETGFMGQQGMPETDVLDSLPSLGQLLQDIEQLGVRTVHAQSEEDDVVVLSRSQTETPVSQALLAAFGRPRLTDYVFLIGSTSDVGVATSAKDGCQDILHQIAPFYSTGSSDATIIRAEDSTKYYLSVGGVKSLQDARTIESAAKQLGTDILVNERAADTDCARWLLGGKVTSVNALARSRH